MYLKTASRQFQVLLHAIRNTFTNPEGEVEDYCFRLGTIIEHLEESTARDGRYSILVDEQQIEKNAVETLKFMRVSAGLNFKVPAYPEYDILNILPIYEYDFREYNPEKISTDPKLFEELENICKQLLIDPSKEEAQNGLIYPITALQLAKNLVNKPGARLIVIYIGNEPVGIFQLLLGKEHIPKRIVEAVQKASGSTNFPDDSDALGKTSLYLT